ncbi:hypothetical protein NQ318_001857 [Aromia moschata]|uniref:DUF659 domain-containing protein n=1 Tax=Aromia moschata TaxID=1265417 RepID=A0AAV8Z151_9CUCU|nr:hypothetical protein NQ318_001857 [Aromia moschata]
MDNIRKDLIKKHVYVTVDETTDQHDNNVVHVLVRALDLNGISAPYLISSKRVDQTTAETITHIVGNALMNVGITTEQVLLFVTDAAAHMKNAGVRLKQIYPHMVHITCLTHGLHQVAEEIRKQYPAVDKFVFATKNLLSKASDHRRNFKRALPNIPLPTDPVCTRWGDLVKVCERYSVLVSAIEKLEKEVTSLNDTLAVVDSVKSSFSAHFDSRSIPADPGGGHKVFAHLNVNNRWSKPALGCQTDWEY